MLIEVFGPGCQKCQVLYKHAQAAVEASAADGHQLVKVEDYAAMAARGILSTPALAIDGHIKFQGKVASTGEILALLRA
jgi:small redox-active disulfide protein 2